MNRERIGIQPGDYLRCPDRATARWHRVVRVGRRRDGTRYVTIRRSRFWRAFGLSAMHRIEWSLLRDLGHGIRRARVPGTRDTTRAAIATGMAGAAGFGPPKGQA